MTNIPCGKCGSVNIRKNGLTAAGASEISLQCLLFLRNTRYSGRETEEKGGTYRKISVRAHSAVCGLHVQSVFGITY
jgi:hypothetical protein